MKKIKLPVVKDLKVINGLALNSRLTQTSYPHLKENLDNIFNCYRNYRRNRGNSLNITPLIGVTTSLKNGLISNYKSPPKGLEYIKKIRDSSPNICPMCGSLKTSSVDHYLPKEDYPEFSVFSRNLIPACDCNSKRGTALMDVNTQVRILHPYYDLVLKTRQISCCINFEPDSPVPKIEITFLNINEPLIESIKYHVEKVIKPSGIIGWLTGQWSSLSVSPASIIQTLPRKKINNIIELRIYLRDALNRYDDSYETPNNWPSIFVHGLLFSPGVTIWILAKHNKLYPI